MTHKFKPWTYNLIKIWFHPALGGIAMFTLIGLLLNLKADPLAIVFVAYVLVWCVTTDILEYLGWNRS